MRNILFYLLCLPLYLSGQSLEPALDAFAACPGMKHGQWGFYALDVTENRVVGQRNGEKSLMPASTLKVVTTSAALGMLGQDHKFRTELQISGSLAGGTLQGNVYLTGYGDPTLGSPYMPGATNIKDLFTALVRALQQAGIKAVNGQIIGDDGFDNNEVAAPSWQWNDLGNYYAAGATGLNIHENLYKATFKQAAKAGERPKLLRLEPEVPGFTLDNELASGGSGDEAYIFAAPFSETGVVRGTIPTGTGEFTIKGSLPDPALFAAYHLRKFLVANGISVSGKASTQRLTPDKNERRTLYTHYSPTLAKIVERANHESINLYCEAMVKAIAQNKSGKAFLAKGLEHIEAFWKARGVDTEGFWQEDGSGLSRVNAVTPKFMAEILRKAHVDKASFGDFAATLPIAGKTGTLKGFCDGTPAQGRIRCKSGYIQRVRGYAGYATTLSGKTIAFCILVNQFSCKESEIRGEIEKIMIKLIQ